MSFSTATLSILVMLKSIEADLSIELNEPILIQKIVSMRNESTEIVFRLRSSIRHREKWTSPPTYFTIFQFFNTFPQ